MTKKIGIVLGLTIVILCGIIWWQNRITVSVIIPIYNAEKYLEKCLDSIFVQSGSFEVIAVNDGSTDNSLKILESYAKKHSNMKVITQENKGVSAARNTGLKEAKNKYITFVDSDDWLEPKAFELSLKMIKEHKPNILLTGFYDVYDSEWVRQTRGEEAAKEISAENKFINRNLDKLELFSPFYGKDAYSDLFYAGGGVRGRFYAKDFLQKYHINFCKKIQSHEDDIFSFRAYLHNPFIAVTKTPIYNYRNRMDSISKSKKILDTMLDSLSVMQQSEEYKNADRRTQMLIKDTWLNLVFLGISNLQRHGVGMDKSKIEKIYKMLDSFDIYNQAELKSCRNYLDLIQYLEAMNINRPL